MRRILLAAHALFALSACSSSIPGPSGSAAPDASDAQTDGAAPPTITVLTTFDPGAFELPEGLVMHKGSAYVGLAPLGKILKIDPDGTRTTYASISPGGNDGYALGLIFDAQDDLFVLATKNNPDAGAVTAGIFKIPPGTTGTVTTPFATAPNMIFPNGADFDGAGNLLVTDSASGVVFKVTPRGEVSTWAAAPELSGSPACPAPLPFPIGANGIVYTPGGVYVANTAKGSLLRIAVAADGSAGAITTLVADCAYVGLDGLALDRDGSLLVAQNGAAGRILRASLTGAIMVLATGAPLDSPASIAVGDWNGARAALVTSSAFFSVGVDGGVPKPSLVRYAPLP